MKKSIFLGIGASFFFAFTFILNRQMNLSGGSWIWSASLRYIFMLPILFIIVALKNDLKDVITDIIKQPIKWIAWSTIGFGLFYAPLSFSSVYGASWIVAGTWQITIVAGALLSPLFYKTIETENGILKKRNEIPKKSLFMSLIILIGIFLIQFQQAKSMSILTILMGVTPVIIASFAYPLGNRKMMEICDGKFSTFQRVFGMTLSSMPFWIILSLIGISKVGLPDKDQIFQSMIVAIFSGIIATILFFKATEMVKGDSYKLAVVESTQSGEVIFTLIGGILISYDKIPTLVGLIGILLVVLGMILNSLASYNK
ncbi:membrane protein [Clostridium polyendosporum]|uniref:Membrane protein n=1 Tax=Clostridium polyendosporum TaxID=69208 RepID=A0A919S1D0_9CLOT|nr:multidrug resistance efflux transporter family protein [Clostridium polyendosporum]GIM30156.1 membrane protein [Clostridium polyendosporum]